MAPNDGKNLTIQVDDELWARYPIRTHLITDADDMVEVVTRYAGENVEPGDMIIISERAVATSQGRAYPISSIRPSALARTLYRFVHRSPYGIGLRSPWTMELALREAGAAKILFAALVSAVTKPFGVRGVFYRIAGRNVASIDGPTDYVIPPYNNYAKLAPLDPDGVAADISEAVGCPVVIIDANDLGVAVLGRSTRRISERLAAALFRDNPLGQSRQQTPLAIVRRLSAAEDLAELDELMLEGVEGEGRQDFFFPFTLYP